MSRPLKDRGKRLDTAETQRQKALAESAKLELKAQLWCKLPLEGPERVTGG
jgi:hypothetical protein